METLNQLSKEQIEIKELPSGDKLKLNVFTINSKKAGPTVYMQSAVHGAEHQGSAVIYTLIEHFLNHEFCGKLILVPNANPLALNTKLGQYTHGRFDPTTGENWNRLYQNFTDLGENSTDKFVDHFIIENKDIIDSKNLEKLKDNFKESLKNQFDKILNSQKYLQLNNYRKLNIQLQKLALTSDIVLDLHTGPVATRYLYSPEYLKDECKYFNFPHNLLIPEKFWGAMDEVSFIPWYKLMAKIENQSQNISQKLFSSYTIELGSEERISFNDAKNDCSKILNYLNYKGMKVKNPWPLENKDSYACKLEDFKTYYSTRGGLYDYLATPGQRCVKGQVIARGINFAGSSFEDFSFNFIAPEDCIIINHYCSSSVPEGSELFQVMVSPLNWSN